MGAKVELRPRRVKGCLKGLGHKLFCFYVVGDITLKDVSRRALETSLGRDKDHLQDH